VTSLRLSSCAGASTGSPPAKPLADPGVQSRLVELGWEIFLRDQQTPDDQIKTYTLNQI
jgi:hypothetical protein